MVHNSAVVCPGCRKEQPLPYRRVGLFALASSASVNSADSSGGHQYAGGFIGRVDGTYTNNGRIETSYCSGAVTNASSYCGAFVGSINRAVITNSYYDCDATPRLAKGGNSSANSLAHTGITPEPGDFVDLQGNVIGRHQGLIHYTVGQRRGLGYAAGGRQYVVEKDMRQNTVTLGPESALYHRALLAAEMNWLSIAEPAEPIHATARTRYHQCERAATVWPLPGGMARILFDEPQRAITPGQAVVLYDGELVLGGGTITQVES
jgi:hypothetical protein